MKIQPICPCIMRINYYTVFVFIFYNNNTNTNYLYYFPPAPGRLAPNILRVIPLPLLTPMLPVMGSAIPGQDADNATLHWDWNPVRRPKAGTGHGSAGRRPSLGLHWARECRPKAVTGLHWARECRPKAVTGHGSAGRRPSQHDTSTKRHSNGPSHHYGGDDIGDCSDLWRQRWRQRLNNDIIRTQDADNATLHWDWNPVRRPKAVTGHGSAGRRPSLGLHWARECRPKAVTGLHWARECRPKAGST